MSTKPALPELECDCLWPSAFGVDVPLCALHRELMRAVCGCEDEATADSAIKFGQTCIYHRHYLKWPGCRHYGDPAKVIYSLYDTGCRKCDGRRTFQRLRQIDSEARENIRSLHEKIEYEEDAAAQFRHSWNTEQNMSFYHRMAALARQIEEETDQRLLKHLQAIAKFELAHGKFDEQDWQIDYRKYEVIMSTLIGSPPGPVSVFNGT